jgi:sugar-specific transcriptional regulator TrmB
MEIKQLLKELGLVDKEPDVFLALLKTEGIQPASVIAKKSDLNRTTVYKILIKLAKMGLVTKTIHHGITAFFVEEPDKRLEALLDKRRKNIDRLSGDLLKIMPEIKNLQRYELTMPKMRVYDGFEGVIRAYEDTVVEKNTIYCFENIVKMPPQIKDYMENIFVPNRMDIENFAHVLSPESEAGKKARKHDKKLLRETRFAPIQLETGVNIYGDKISFFSYDPDDMFGVVLESKAFANSLREIFEFCYKNAK